RGGIVNEAALYDALKNQRIAGAAIDVFEEEPYKGNLCKLENVLLTQHMGSCSYDCRLLMEKGAAEEIIRFFKGEPLLNEVPEQEYLNQS
ncbi:NAD(P)-dependent oxidoreductase, partial [Leptospira borgpetersenii]